MILQPCLLIVKRTGSMKLFPVHSLMFDVQDVPGLPLTPLPFTLLFSRDVCIELCLLICPTYFNFLIWMMANRHW